MASTHDITLYHQTKIPIGFLLQFKKIKIKKKEKEKEKSFKKKKNSRLGLLPSCHQCGAAPPCSWSQLQQAHTHRLYKNYLPKSKCIIFGRLFFCYKSDFFFSLNSLLEESYLYSYKQKGTSKFFLIVIQQPRMDF